MRGLSASSKTKYLLASISLPTLLSIALVCNNLQYQLMRCISFGLHHFYHLLYLISPFILTPPCLILLLNVTLMAIATATSTSHAIGTSHSQDLMPFEGTRGRFDFPYPTMEDDDREGEDIHGVAFDEGIEEIDSKSSQSMQGKRAITNEHGWFMRAMASTKIEEEEKNVKNVIRAMVDIQIEGEVVEEEEEKYAIRAMASTKIGGEEEVNVSRPMATYTKIEKEIKEEMNDIRAIATTKIEGEGGEGEEKNGVRKNESYSSKRAIRVPSLTTIEDDKDKYINSVTFGEGSLEEVKSQSSQSMQGERPITNGHKKKMMKKKNEEKIKNGMRKSESYTSKRGIEVPSPTMEEDKEEYIHSVAFGEGLEEVDGKSSQSMKGKRPISNELKMKKKEEEKKIKNRMKKSESCSSLPAESSPPTHHNETEEVVKMGSMRKSETFLSLQISSLVGHGHGQEHVRIGESDGYKEDEEDNICTQSQEEFNRRVEDFINRFNQQMRLQRQQSLERYQKVYG